MLGFLLDGGWLMLPLTLCSIVALAIIIDRIRAFRAAGTDGGALRKQISEALVAGRLDEALRVCDDSDGPLAATLLVGLTHYRRLCEKNKRAEEIESAIGKIMEDYAPKALHGLEKRLNSLVLIASISPLLGMTGTVTGMIRSFDVMAATAGLEAGAVAGGIAEALITTAAGLLIAIPAVVAYNVFSRRVDDYAQEIEAGISDVVEAVREA